MTSDVPRQRNISWCIFFSEIKLLHIPGVRGPVGAGNFSPHHRVQTGSEVHTVYLMGTRGAFPGGKAAGA
jgi:hypothetical protein